MYEQILFVKSVDREVGKLCKYAMAICYGYGYGILRESSMLERGNWKPKYKKGSCFFLSHSSEFFFFLNCEI